MSVTTALPRQPRAGGATGVFKPSAEGPDSCLAEGPGPHQLYGHNRRRGLGHCWHLNGTPEGDRDANCRLPAPSPSYRLLGPSLALARHSQARSCPAPGKPCACDRAPHLPPPHWRRSARMRLATWPVPGRLGFFCGGYFLLYFCFPPRLPLPPLFHPSGKQGSKSFPVLKELKIL